MAGLNPSSQRQKSEINVIPMLDILLVLLVVAMLGLMSVLIPRIQLAEQPPESGAPSRSTSIVLELPDSGGFVLNGVPVEDSALESYLADVFDERPVKSLLFAPGRTRRYSEVIDAMDRSYNAGVQVLGLMPRRTRAGSN